MVKLPVDLYAQVLETSRSRKDVVIDALKMYFSANEHNHQAQTHQDNNSTIVLIEQLQQKDQQISELHIML